ncbi:MAG: inositol monophosphatase [Endomicrobium sp.]|jgi:myo-inositol-1(or 4)-monophosphatase|uniref:inositol monophosphatase family protein n=1 Tax=Candidatus Endomicrobiellum cubanum TaxID=3242325 RepID=UPI00281B476A|nr:inositol monophosphatase [Endomicrobium sp.]
MKFSSFTNVALTAAQKGAEVLLKHYNGKLNIEYKSEIDPVTQADKGSQKAIIKIIKDTFPEHGILAEEDGVNEVDKEYCWIIDPLDGTVNFVHSLPMFAVSIGLKYKNEIITGVVYSPLMNEVFIAEKGKGAWLNSKKIKVSSIKDNIRALGVTGFPYSIKKDNNKILKNFERVIVKAQGVRRLGSAALDLAYVACGRFEFFWEQDLKAWDIAAGILLVKEAGGIVSDYSGDKDCLFKSTMLASNSLKIHKEILKIVND